MDHEFAVQLRFEGVAEDFFEFGPRSQAPVDEVAAEDERLGRMVLKGQFMGSIFHKIDQLVHFVVRARRASIGVGSH